MNRAMLIVCGFFSFAALANGADDASTEDLQRLQGKWRLVERIVDGDKSAIKLLWTISGKEIIDGPETGLLAKFEVDAATKPKNIDITFVSKLDPKNMGKTVRGIYEIDGDTLKLCGPMEDEAKVRPTTFESKEGSGVTLLVFERAAEALPVKVTVISKGDLKDDDDVRATFLVEVTAKHKHFRPQQMINLQIGEKTRLMKQVGKKQEPIDVASLVKGAKLRFSGYQEILESEPVIVTPGLVVLVPIE
jgi:uncharacterized protein (TIGR03067 family)